MFRGGWWSLTVWHHGRPIAPLSPPPYESPIEGEDRCSFFWRHRQVHREEGTDEYFISHSPPPQEWIIHLTHRYADVQGGGCLTSEGHWSTNRSYSPPPYESPIEGEGSFFWRHRQVPVRRELMNFLSHAQRGMNNSSHTSIHGCSGGAVISDVRGSDIMVDQ